MASGAAAPHLRRTGLNTDQWDEAFAFWEAKLLGSELNLQFSDLTPRLGIMPRISLNHTTPASCT